MYKFEIMRRLSNLIGNDHQVTVKQRWLVIGWVAKNLLCRDSPCFGRHVKPLAPTNPPWARVVGYGPFILWVIHKEGLCPSSVNINMLMMMKYLGTLKSTCIKQHFEGLLLFLWYYYDHDTCK
jgi:hypothetical protein